jgi:hypothetical protein
MEYFSVEGDWWLPEHQNHRVSGTLTHSADGLDLVLHGQLRTYPTPAENEIIKFEPPKRTVTPVIHGRTRDWKDVTVLDASGENFDGPFPGEVRESYRVNLALLGCHALSDQFSGAWIGFDRLDDWSDAPSILIDPSTGETDEGQITNRVTAGVRLERLALAEVSIDGGLLKLETGVEGSRDNTSIHLDQFSVFTVEMEKPASVQEIVGRWVRPLQDLLIYSIGRSTRITTLMLRPALDNERGGYFDAYFSAVQSKIESKAGAARNSPQSYSEPALMTVGSCPLPIDDLLKRWFALRSDLREVFVLLHAHHYAPFIYSENRFASIFASAEAFHKKRFQSQELDRPDHKRRVQSVLAALDAEEVEEETKAWAKRVLSAANYKPLWSRIDELVRSTGAIGDAVLSANPDFAKISANGRTGVAHGGSSVTQDSVARYWHGDVLHWVLRACLLVELGVPLSTVERRVLEKYPFQHAVEQVQVQSG